MLREKLVQVRLRRIGMETCREKNREFNGSASIDRHRDGANGGCNSVLA